MKKKCRTRAIADNTAKIDDLNDNLILSPEDSSSFSSADENCSCKPQKRRTKRSSLTGMAWIRHNAKGIPISVWSVAAVLFLIPIVPNLIAPFLFVIPFFVTIFTQKGAFSDILNLFKRRNFLAIFAFCDVVIICLGIIPANNKPYAALMSLMWVACLSAFFAIIISIKKKEHFLLCGGALVLSCGISALISLLQCYNYYGTNIFGVHINNPFWVNFEKSLLENLPILEFNFDGNLDPTRFCSTFLNSGVYAMFLIFIVPLTIYFITVFMNKKMRLSALFITIISAVALGFAFSRTSYAVFILMMIFLVVAYSIVTFRNKRHLRQSPSILPLLSLIIIIPLCLFFLYVSLPDSIIRRFESSFTADNSKLIRFDLWEASVKLILQKPIFGYGTGMENQWMMFRDLPGFGVNIYDQAGQVISAINEPHAHNIGFQIMLEGGILRLTTTLTVLAIFFKRVLSLVKVHNKNTKFLGICLCACMLGFFMNGATDFLFVDPKLCGIYMMFLALGGCAQSIYKFSKNEYGKCPESTYNDIK